MNDKYNWLEDLPTNPPKPDDTGTRNTAQPAVPNYGAPPLNYQPVAGDYIVSPGNSLGANAEVVLVGGTFVARFQGVQAALEYLSRLFESQGQASQVWQRLPNGQLSPMKTNG